MKAFKAYDIRGIWGEDLDQDIVYKVGYFFPKVIPCNKVLIGRDGRTSSDEMFKALSDGLSDAGVDVYDAGLSTTPMIYWGTGKFAFDASIMITASHNGATYNGLKLSGKDVEPVGYDNGLNIIELLIERGVEIVKKTKGLIKDFPLQDHYLQFLKTYMADFSSLKIAIDCSNGVASLLAHDLFGPTIYYLNDTIDGAFPAHEPNPLLPENQDQIKKAVLDKNCDIGLIFDGDADRVMFIDENGHFISPDLIIAILGHYFFEERKETGKVVQDIRTSKAVADYLRQFETEVVTWKVGRAFGATKLKQVDGIFGGELAGHYYFKDFYYSDSGMLAALLVIRVMLAFKEKGIPFSQIIARISTYANTGEVNFKIKHKAEAMDAVKFHFMKNEPPISFLDVDGYRLDFENWWFNIRPSNTEPYLRFLAEAKDQNLLDTKTKIIFDIIGKFS
ncbi:MAG: phosphomannomutase/phosphoglucomutase [Bacteroidales bacterium]|jgi:phosphomannomutase|nr:phosphomannomutase/phosphoglucomutase [Bacteroidales bacterium]